MLAHTRTGRLVSYFFVGMGGRATPPGINVATGRDNACGSFAGLGVNNVGHSNDGKIDRMSCVVLRAMSSLRLLRPKDTLRVDMYAPRHFLHRNYGMVHGNCNCPSMFGPSACIVRLVQRKGAPRSTHRNKYDKYVRMNTFKGRTCVLANCLGMPGVLRIALRGKASPMSNGGMNLMAKSPYAFQDCRTLCSTFLGRVRCFMSVGMHIDGCVSHVFTGCTPTAFLSLFVSSYVTGKGSCCGYKPHCGADCVRYANLNAVASDLSILGGRMFRRHGFGVRRVVRTASAGFRKRRTVERFVLGHAPFFNGSSRCTSHVTVRVFGSLCSTVRKGPGAGNRYFRLGVLSAAYRICFNGVVGTAPGNHLTKHTVDSNASPSRKTSARKPSTIVGSLKGLSRIGDKNALLGRHFLPSLLGRSRSVTGLMDLVHDCFTLKKRRVRFGVMSATALRTTRGRPRRCQSLLMHMTKCDSCFGSVGASLRCSMVTHATRRAF